MSANAAFAATPHYALVQVSGPNTAYDGTGTIATLFTSPVGGSGSRVDSITWCATATNAAGIIKFFARESDEDTWRLMFWAPLPATTVDAGSGQGPYWGYMNQVNWVLSAGSEIGVAIHASETWNVHCGMAGDF